MTLPIPSADAWGADPWGVVSNTPAPASTAGRGPLFFAAEIDAYRPGGTAPTVTGDAWGAMPWGALSKTATAVETFDTIRASDLGYRTAPTDPAGVVVYPPFLSSAFAIDRRLNLDPSKPSAAAAWGSLTLADPDQRFDAIASTDNCDGRGVRIYIGQKVYDASRGYYGDPTAANLGVLFSGVATPWFLSDTDLQIPLRDATYWLERGAQTTAYGGTGALDGGTDLTGLPKPKTRGFVRNITPVLVDATNRIYQWTDGAGTVVNLYEGGALTIAPAGDVSDLYSGTTPTGYYRTNNARGLFQLGATPAHQITIDATGSFPTGGYVTGIADLAKWFLLDDMALPASLMDLASFSRAGASYPYQAGFYTGTTATDGATVAGQIVGSAAGKLFPRRNGMLALMMLRALPSTSGFSATFSRDNAVSLTPRTLGAPLDPPPWRWQVGYAKAWTVQTSDLGGSLTPGQKQFIASSDRFATWIGNSVLTAYRRPSDPPQLPTFLASAADAQTVANDLGTLWGVRRRQYDLVLPVSVGRFYDLGDVVRVQWPMDDLSSGRLGQIIGEQFRAQDSTITFQVLI